MKQRLSNTAITIKHLIIRVLAQILFPGIKEFGPVMVLDLSCRYFI